MPESKFSVIVPVYNVEQYLGDCLDSILRAAEGYDVEIVCVDDGSTDGSGGILDRRSAEDPRVKVVRQANSGEGAARNRGVEAASGEWMVFVDADDMVRETLFSTVSEMMRKSPEVDLIGYRSMGGTGNDPTWPDGSGSVRDVGIDRAIDDVLVRYCACNFAYRRSVFKDVKFPHNQGGADLAYAAKAFAVSKKCLVTDREEYFYRKRNGSCMLSGFTPGKVSGVIRSNVEMFKALDSSGKKVGRAFATWRADGWLETLPRIILPLRRKPEWKEVWSLWLDSMSEAAKINCLLERQRKVAGRVAASRSAWAARLHCLFLSRFGRKGERDSCCSAGGNG